MTETARRYMGNSVPRKEDPALLTGRATFTDDISEPRVSTPRPPQHREQRRPLDHPDPGEVVGEKAGDLREGEDEDQVEEQLEGGNALLGRIATFRGRMC
jgi:hypothetical protein